MKALLVGVAVVGVVAGAAATALYMIGLAFREVGRGSFEAGSAAIFDEDAVRAMIESRPPPMRVVPDVPYRKVWP